MEVLNYIKWKIRDLSIYKTNDLELCSRMIRFRNVNLFAEYYTNGKLTAKQFSTTNKKTVKKLKKLAKWKSPILRSHGPKKSGK